MDKTSPFQAAWNFLGIPPEMADPARALAWVLPVPYESTTSYGAGTRDGPSAIVAASRQVEHYDRELGCEPALRYGIHTTDPLAPAYGSPDAMAKVVEKTVADILRGSSAAAAGRSAVPRVLCLLGGEHSISPGAVRGVASALGQDDLVAVQIDAHADLRDSYEGSPFSHACAARRILEVCPLLSLGVRSLSTEESEFAGGCRRLRSFFAEESASGQAVLEALAEFVRGKKVYLTVDLDGLDPSIMPAVGTPEPGGLSWERTLDIVRTVAREAGSLPAFDVVELAPIPGLRAPDFLAAKLTYKVFSLALRKELTRTRAKRPRGGSRKR